jgi:uncharacterized protein (TIGR03083 family)
MSTATVTRPSKQDYQRMTRVELMAMREHLHSLSESQWDTPSLCAGWNVRHVIGHMCLGSTMSPLALPRRALPYGLNIAKASSRESYKYGEEHTPAELLATFDRVLLGDDPRPGLGKVAPPKEWFVDKLIHNQDIRRPLGVVRDIPGEHLVAAIDVLPHLGGFLKSKGHTRGLRFVATDLDHAVGDGPEVRGPAEPLVLAMSGRAVGLDEFEGDGLATLRARIGS